MNNKENLNAAMDIFRTLQLRVSLFNIVFSRILFLAKILCLAVGILGGFAGLRLVHRNPAMAFVYFLASVEAVVGYVTVFSLAYKVTEVGEVLTGVMEGVASRVVFLSPGARESLERILQKTPQLAMSVGGFHRVQRETIPIFVDFVMRQIVGLLVSF
jgi:hypothetical protein